jgi:hypothetical protein
MCGWHEREPRRLVSTQEGRSRLDLAARPASSHHGTRQLAPAARLEVAVQRVAASGAKAAAATVARMVVVATEAGGVAAATVVATAVVKVAAQMVVAMAAAMAAARVAAVRKVVHTRRWP